ncbi:hypothetical protein [Kamptonema formosum]|uniref:hypothetical protein n=1 Tax=Kamptonema formosum TaxID=331992 RepID=UPI0018E21882|nr:hypothetical protein [Oscillatoria sp. PCC 10802]
MHGSDSEGGREDKFIWNPFDELSKHTIAGLWHGGIVQRAGAGGAIIYKIGLAWQHRQGMTGAIVPVIAGTPAPLCGLFCCVPAQTGCKAIPSRSIIALSYR